MCISTNTSKSTYTDSNAPYFWALTKGFQFENPRQHGLTPCEFQSSACFCISTFTLYNHFLIMTSTQTLFGIEFSSTTSSAAPFYKSLPKPILKHIFQLGDKTSVVPLGTDCPDDKCLIVFPNYVTGGLISAECPLALLPQAEFFLKRAHAERACQKPPQHSLTEQTAADLLQVSIKTLHSRVRKGLLYRWIDYRPGRWWSFSHAEVQALLLTKCRIM
jgi:hypothetical protein